MHFMAVGLDTTLDNALKIAAKGLLDWLQQDYYQFIYHLLFRQALRY